jgi:hypothetical protein
MEGEYGLCALYTHIKMNNETFAIVLGRGRGMKERDGGGKSSQCTMKAYSEMSQ